MRHFLSLFDVTPAEINGLLDRAAELKAARQRGEYQPLLAGKVLGLIVEKPSLRTRVSFETAMAQLGGASIFQSGPDASLGQRESIPDFARTISQYVDAVVLRTFRHRTIEEFASHATVPVINGLSDTAHPCQALGDLLTVRELFGDIKGRTVVFVGDGNNVAKSLAIGCGKLGARFILAGPTDYHFDPTFLKTFRKRLPRAELLVNGDPRAAVRTADVIYTDVWTSMGQEQERDLRHQNFAAYQVNPELLALAPQQARLMHCLPAHRGEEVTDEVVDGPQSVVFQQAGNRLHAQKALLVWLLG
jgi:ornithine carbamoyltransferase